MPSIERELFDGFLRQRRCQCCRRNLHPDKSNRYRTRLVGLCFKCLALFNKSRQWTIQGFIEEIRAK